MLACNPPPRNGPYVSTANGKYYNPMSKNGKNCKTGLHRLNSANYTSPCSCIPGEKKLGFHQVTIPLNTSLDSVVKEYAMPLARRMKHDRVYISTKFKCK
uniref:Uncharacterized protein n=1 Tax=Cacopsylla melanoneura TaxID=428564 RepID=A0A8D8TEJ4_9HEMI